MKQFNKAEKLNHVTYEVRGPVVAEAARMTAQGMDYHPSDPRYRALEEAIAQKINALGTGPAGFGGDTTLLKLNICSLPTRIAGLPCAVNVCCHASRHAKAVI